MCGQHVEIKDFHGSSVFKYTSVSGSLSLVRSSYLGRHATLYPMLHDGPRQWLGRRQSQPSSQAFPSWLPIGRKFL